MTTIENNIVKCIIRIKMTSNYILFVRITGDVLFKIRSTNRNEVKAKGNLKATRCVIKQAENAYDAQIDYQRVLPDAAKPICTRFDVSALRRFNVPYSKKRSRIICTHFGSVGFPTCGNCFSLKAVMHSACLLLPRSIIKFTSSRLHIGIIFSVPCVYISQVIFLYFKSNKYCVIIIYFHQINYNELIALMIVD